MIARDLRLMVTASLVCACAGTTLAQPAGRPSGSMPRQGAFSSVGTFAVPMAGPARQAAPAAAPAPSAPTPQAAAAAGATRTGSFYRAQPTYAQPATPALSGRGGRAALPGRPGIMPRNTGAGLAPSEVTVPQYTVGTPGWAPVNDGPVRVQPLTGRSAFDGPLNPAGTPIASREGSFARGSFTPGGFDAAAAYSDGRFSFAAHIGSGAGRWHDHSWYRPCDDVWPHWCSAYPWYPVWGYGYWPNYYYEPSYTLPVVNSSSVMYQDPALNPGYVPGQAQGAPAAPLAPFDHATLLMQSGRFADASKHFREVVKADPGDAAARRWLGISLMLAGRTQDGALEVARAYQADPDIADAAPDLEAMGLTVRQMTDLCAPVITYARRVNSAPGFVTAAMLMQARSRPDLAAKMLDSARNAGLDSGLMVRLTQSMTR